MFSTQITGSDSGVGADVTADKAIKVSLPLLKALMASVRVFNENDPGDITGEPLLRSPEVSPDFRARVGQDTLFDTEVFNYTAQNTTKHIYRTSTMTLTWANNALNTNGANITTNPSAASFSTYRQFPIVGTSALYAEFSMALSNAPVTNTTIDFGLFTLAATTPFAPTDGAYFRLTSAGMVGVTNFNTAEQSTPPFEFVPAINQVYKYNITMNNGQVEFWIDDVLYGILEKPIATGSPNAVQSLPLSIRHSISTGTASGVLSAKFFNYTVSLGDINTNRLWPTTQAGQGLASIQGASGFTQGQTANYANSAAPASAALSNTAAGYTTLGGQFQFAAVAGAETDYALFAFQVPAPTQAISGKNLVIRGIWIDSFNMGAAVATTPTLLQWALAVGATAVSLATAEAATTRAPRRIPLGSQSFPVGAAIGADSGKRIDVNLDAPLTVEPGTFVHVLLKMPVGTATASQIIRGVVGINGYWE